MFPNIAEKNKFPRFGFLSRKYALTLTQKETQLPLTDALLQTSQQVYPDPQYQGECAPYAILSAANYAAPS